MQGYSLFVCAVLIFNLWLCFYLLQGSCGCFSDIVIIDTIIILGLLLTLFYQSSIETNDVLDVEFVSFSNHFTFKVTGCGKGNYNHQARTQAADLFKS